MNADELLRFEEDVADAFKARKIHAPIHLSAGNEKQLIDIFKGVQPEDWVFSTWRSHYHALLKGIPKRVIMDAILDGNSIALNFPSYRFFSSAIVGGTLPIACGVAAHAEYPSKVWCFVGDMCASTGAFQDAVDYAKGHDLPITFVVEDNGLSTNTPTLETWGAGKTDKVIRYQYNRGCDHCGAGEYVSF